MRRDQRADARPLPRCASFIRRRRANARFRLRRSLGFIEYWRRRISRATPVVPRPFWSFRNAQVRCSGEVTLTT